MPGRENEVDFSNLPHVLKKSKMLKTDLCLHTPLLLLALALLCGVVGPSRQRTMYPPRRLRRRCSRL